jgi:glycerol-1-phosphate dehydrogenase [NAD(P)+]
VIEALIKAHEIRPERYTILDTGLNRIAAVKAAEATGII